MSDVLFTIDGVKIAADGDKFVRSILSSGTIAVSSAARALEKRLEMRTQQSVPGRLYKAWASRSYPERGPAKDPVGTVFINGGARSRGAMAFWSRPGEVRGSRGQFLAIPADGFRGWPSGRRFVNNTPEEWQRRTGIKLRYVYRPGRAALLVADNARPGARGSIGRSRSRQFGPAARGSSTVIVFILIPLVKFRAAFAIEPEIARAEGELVSDFLARVRGAGA